MKIGMLWQDLDPNADFKAKVERAASYYVTKYGQVPNLCFVHPSMGPVRDQAKPERIEVRTNRFIRPNHFWIGLAESAA